MTEKAKKPEKTKKKSGWPKGRRPTPEMVKKRTEANRLARLRRKLIQEFS